MLVEIAGMGMQQQETLGKEEDQQETKCENTPYRMPGYLERGLNHSHGRLGVKPSRQLGIAFGKPRLFEGGLTGTLH